MEDQFIPDKILKHSDKIAAWLAGENPFAVTVEIDPTNVCNHKCPGCFGFAVDSRESLSRDEMESFITQISKLGAKALAFTGGGEPLCNPHTEKMIHHAKRKRLDVGLITNGSLLGKTDMESLLESCLWIRISLDAGNSKLHKLTHGIDDFYKIVSNIARLVETKERTRADCTVGIAYLTGKHTDDYAEMMEFVDAALGLGVDYAQFRPYMTATNKTKENRTNFRVIDWRPFESRSTERTKILRSTHKYDAMRQGYIQRYYEKCYGHQFATTLTATGDMTVCCHTRGLSWATLGNIREKTVEEIWNSQERRDAVNRIDLAKCPLLCRCDRFNEVLWHITQPVMHPNFL